MKLRKTSKIQNKDRKQARTIETTFVEQVARKRSNSIQKSNDYVDLRFICGSVAIVERLWSTCKSLLKLDSKSITLIVFEAIIFLRMNTDYWSLSTVSEAMKMTRIHRKFERINADSEHDLVIDM